MKSEEKKKGEERRGEKRSEKAEKEGRSVARHRVAEGNDGIMSCIAPPTRELIAIYRDTA